jgi:tetratricopeptide (TPR) repeat protein
MIKTELYFDFRRINREDYSEQINFFETYKVFFDNEDAFKGLKSRQEFIRRIFILHSCGIAYSRTHKYENSIEILDRVISEVQKNTNLFMLDLNKEHYYIDSLFEKGKAQYYLKKFSVSETTFKLIMDTGFSTYTHSYWYTYSRNARLFDNLNNWILYSVLVLLTIPEIILSLSPAASLRLSVLNVILIILYLINPSKKLSNFFTKKNIEEYNKQFEKRPNTIEYYTEKINNNSNDYVSLLERGISFSLIDDFDNSLKDLDAVLEINPSNSDALYYRAIALTKSDRNEDAIKDLSTLLELNEADKAEIYNNRGHTYMILKNYKSALNDYNKAIELEPHFALYRFNRAYLFQDNGNNNAAIEDYNIVIKLEPENCVAITNRGEAHYAIGDKSLALIDFNRAKEFDYKEAIENLEKLEFE